MLKDLTKLEECVFGKFSKHLILKVVPQMEVQRGQV